MNAAIYAEGIVQEALEALRIGGKEIHIKLNAIPDPVYATDAEGVLQYFNYACVSLAGRTPHVRRDKWCVTWKLYTLEGEFLPHDQCPMAVAIKERRSVRDVEAIAERPNGTRICFKPFPTPLTDDTGAVVGAVNILIDITGEKGLSLLEKATKCERLASQIDDVQAVNALRKVAENCRKQAASLLGPAM
jgi:PAS domain-containing protein